MRAWTRWTAVLAGVAAVATGCPTDPPPDPGPATIVVTTTADAMDGADGVISFREAVAQAAADGVASTVVLEGGLDYALTRCDLGAVAHGAAQSLVITTDDDTRATVRQTCSPAQVLRFGGAPVELRHLVVRGGRMGSASQCSWPFNPPCNRGAGIEATSHITLLDVEMTDHRADLGPGGTAGGALAAVAGATITESSFHDNWTDRWGGAVLSGGPLVVEDSTFVANHALEGNALAVESGGAVIRGSRFESNTGGSGGAIVVRGGTLELTDSVLRANQSGGGPGAAIWFSGGMSSVRIERTAVVQNTGRAGALTSQSIADLRILDSTVTDNTATMAIRDQYNASAGGLAIAGQATVTVEGSTIAANSGPAGGGANIDVTPSTTTTFTFRDSVVDSPLGGGTNCSLRSGTASWTTSFVSDATCGAAASPGSALLGPLTQVGATWLRIPQSGSVLRDAHAAPCATASDQRGVSRPAGTGCDLGADER